MPMTLQVVPTESLTLEQQLSQYPLFNQLTAQAQAQLISDLQKQQALPQGIQLITLPTLASAGTASATASPSPDSQTTGSMSVSSVRKWKHRLKSDDMTGTILLIFKLLFILSLSCSESTPATLNTL